MKSLIPVFCLLLTANLYAQDKYNYNYFNKLTPVQGSEYVIASIENHGKMKVHGEDLLFINTRNGQANRVDLPKDASVHTGSR